MAPLGALTQAWTAAEAALPLGWHYNGGGCAQLLPTHEAPAGADWSPYCLGLCTADE
jgi:hypothetical protein